MLPSGQNAVGVAKRPKRLRDGRPRSNRITENTVQDGRKPTPPAFFDRVEEVNGELLAEPRTFGGDPHGVVECAELVDQAQMLRVFAEPYPAARRGLNRLGRKVPTPRHDRTEIRINAFDPCLIECVFGLVARTQHRTELRYRSRRPTARTHVELLQHRSEIRRQSKYADRPRERQRVRHDNVG